MVFNMYEKKNLIEIIFILWIIYVFNLDGVYFLCNLFVLNQLYYYFFYFRFVLLGQYKNNIECIFGEGLINVGMFY